MYSTKKSEKSWYLSIKKLEQWAYYQDLFNKQECEKIIESSLKLEKLDAKVGDQDNVKHQIRKNSVSWLPSDDLEFEWIFRKITDAVSQLNDQFWQFDLDYIEILQFTHYDQPGDFYNLHSDILHSGTHYRKMSFSLQLSDPESYEGGDLEFFESTDVFQPSKREQGTLIMFPSFVPHRVSPIRNGKRYSLVGWVCGKSFK